MMFAQHLFIHLSQEYPVPLGRGGCQEQMTNQTKQAILSFIFNRLKDQEYMGNIIFPEQSKLDLQLDNWWSQYENY